MRFTIAIVWAMATLLMACSSEPRVTTSHRPSSPDANHALRWDRNLPDDNADFGSGISTTAGHRPYWYPERRIAHSHTRAHAYTYDGAYPYRDTWA